LEVEGDEDERGGTCGAAEEGQADLYFPATFLLEEVAFRGALDAHVHDDGEGRGWQSAALVSALWGLWHLPVSSGLPLPVQVVELVTVHVALGLPLSFAGRRSRNLAGPALAHAVNDAVRSAAMLGLQFSL
jgi:membrane protease YdiL (CAAX protease family)